MHDGQRALARRAHVRHGLLDRGRDHERRAVLADAAAVLRVDRDAEPLELRARLGTLAGSSRLDRSSAQGIAAESGFDRAVRKALRAARSS